MAKRLWTPRAKHKRQLLDKAEAVAGPIKYRPDPGWEYMGGFFVHKGSKYGCRYRCLWCGTTTLGWPASHAQTCPVLDKHESDE